MANPTKFLGSIPVSSWSFDIDTNPPSSPDTVTLTDGTYYLSDDGGADDLIAHLETQINAAPVVADTVAVSIDADGLVSIVNSSDTSAYTITWGANGAALQSVLRFSGATTGFSDTAATGSRAARYFAHTDRPTRVDIPIDRKNRQLDESDDGSMRATSVGPIITRYLAQVRYRGPHRTTTANGHTEFKDFFATTIGPGRTFRWYPDTTVTTAWAELTNPFGYHVVKERKLAEYQPREVIKNSYTWYLLNLDMQVQP